MWTTKAIISVARFSVSECVGAGARAFLNVDAQRGDRDRARANRVAVPTVPDINHAIATGACVVRAHLRADAAEKLGLIVRNRLHELKWVIH